MTDHEPLGRYAVHLATGAAQLVRRAVEHRVDLGVSQKSTSTDLVTVVDQASERWLIEQLSADRPGDAVLAEEGGGRDGSTGVRWLLDPIDGTVNFVLGLPSYSVSVAAERDGRTVAAAVCNPVTGELFRATLGGGAYLDDAPLRVSARVALERAVIGTGFAYDRERRARQGRVAAELLPRVADIRRMGSAALDLCSVACGRLDGYYEAGLNPWDSAAGALVAEEAGCRVSGLGGEPASDRMTVAAPAALAPDLLALLAELHADV